MKIKLVLISSLTSLPLRKMTLSFSLLLVCATFAQTAPMDVRKVADSVDRHYNNLSSMQTDFTEVYHGGGIARTELGTMWLRKPGKMRWEYRAPRENSRRPFAHPGARPRLEAGEGTAGRGERPGWPTRGGWSPVSWGWRTGASRTTRAPGTYGWR